MGWFLLGDGFCLKKCPRECRQLLLAILFYFEFRLIIGVAIRCFSFVFFEIFCYTRFIN